ncbi:MAG: hypothetical protein NTW65_09055 [Deltaproteobacteria bacterium]|nr:hypothetical protein [Deltaproteobacteria bacterium]
MPEEVKITEALGYGWRKAKENLVFFIGSYIIMGVVQFIPIFCTVLAIVNLMEANESLAIGLGIAAFLSECIAFDMLYVGYVKAATNVINGTGPMFGDMKPSMTDMFRVLVAAICWFTLIGIGLVLFIIPGIWFAVTYWPFGWVIINKQVGPIEGLRQARELTKGKRFNHVIFFVLCGIILLLGALALGLGLIIAFPTTLLATTYLYRKISGLEVTE